MFNKNQDPILVEVHDGRWDSYGDPTPRALFLHEYLQNMGGVNESVPPGLYHFNVIIRLFKTYISLEPAE